MMFVMRPSYTILSTEKKITFRRDLRLLTTENINKNLKMFSSRVLNGHKVP